MAPTRTSWFRRAVVGATLAAAGCSASSPTATPGDGAPPPGGGVCEVTVTGDVATSFSSGGGELATNSDYWFRTDDLVRAARVTGLTEAQISETLAAGRFVVRPFGLNCGTPGQSSLSVLHPPEATRAEVPFGPGTYPVVASGTARPGQVTTLVVLDGDAYETTGGTLEVTRFDARALEGRFEMTARQLWPDTGPTKLVRLTGRFSLGCTGAPGAGCATATG
jgi:hypothetical protein